jgi:hypothetical protein
MDAIQSSDTFTPAEVCQLNYCRLYSKAITLSDPTSIDGQGQDHSKLSDNHLLLSSHTHGTSIYQERPWASVWRWWRKLNAIWSNPDGTLIQPLGDWVLPFHRMHQCHPAYWFSGMLWIHIQGKYKQCTLASDRVFRETPISCDWATLPKHAVPMLALQAEPGYWLITQQSHILEVNAPPMTGTFTEYIASLPN